VSDDSLEVDELAEPEAGETPKPEKEPKPEKRPKPEKAEKPDKADKGPGFFSRLGQSIAAPFSARRLGGLLNARTIIGLVVALLIVWLLLANLAPVRVVLFFWTVDVPKAVAFIFDVALGALLMWLWVRWRGQARAAKEGESK
jgi:uncharacterized integral membrane protein